MLAVAPVAVVWLTLNVPPWWLVTVNVLLVVPYCAVSVVALRFTYPFALAIVNEENQRLAIGKGGINIKLASKLTKFKINVKTMEEVQREGNQ